MANMGRKLIIKVVYLACEEWHVKDIVIGPFSGSHYRRSWTNLSYARYLDARWQQNPIARVRSNASSGTNSNTCRGDRKKNFFILELKRNTSVRLPAKNTGAGRSVAPGTVVHQNTVHSPYQ